MLEYQYKWKNFRSGSQQFGDLLSRYSDMIYRTHNVVFTASVLVIAALFLAGSYVIVSEYDLLFTDNAQGITNFKKLEKRLAGIRDRKIQNELVYRYGESVRDVVREENEMIDQRMMRMLTLNGLLFTTLGFAWGTSKVLNRLPLILSGLGAVSSFSFGFILQTGLKSIESTYDLWCILSKYSEYPPPLFQV